jgi:hypothetical protein
VKDIYLIYGQRLGDRQSPAAAAAGCWLRKVRQAPGERTAVVRPYVSIPYMKLLNGSSAFIPWHVT